jgi:beta-N-acetylhexosaminidase
MIDVAGYSLTDDEITRLRDPRVGGVILFSRNFESMEQVGDLIAAVHAIRTPQLLVAVDQEGGRVQRFREGFSELPAARWLGLQYDIDPDAGRRLARLSGWLMAAELLDVGIDISFAPVVDLDLGLSEVIGDRSLHRDPDAVSNLAISYMLGMRDAGMMAVAKHFPGHGAVVADSHLELPEDHRTIDAMEDDFRPYERMIENGLPGVMVAHVRYPKVDRHIASLSPYWLQTELRQRLGFKGAIFSDDLNMSAVHAIGDMAERVTQTLEAGADMALICNDPDGVEQALDGLGDIENPVGQLRLVAMRPSSNHSRQEYRKTGQWDRALATIMAATAAPPLRLDG